MMKALLTALTLALAAGVAHADGDAAAGETKATVCAACHGPAGNSVNPEWPSLAGQHASYTTAQLRAFKAGERNNPLMSAQAAGLSDADMADLAAYYAAQTPVVGEADPALLDQGASVYRGGNKETGVSACLACHGPAGAGNPGNAVPRIGGQHATYVAASLRAYASGDRDGGENQIMRDIASRLSEAEIDAVASFIEGLYQ